jgi:transposase
VGPGEPWSLKHRAWLVSLRFVDRASQLTIADYLHSHDVLIARRDRIEDELATLATESRCKDTVARLRCLRGIDTLSALGLCAEIGEFERFDHPDQLAAYIGIVPCEHSSGQQRRQGSITKAGSTHARRLLIEASCHYRRQPGVGLKLERRQRDQPPQVINIAWRAQRSLNARWSQLKDARHKPNGVVAVAIARELAGYCWEIATCATHPDPVPPASVPAGDHLTHAASVPPKHTPTSARRITASL